MLFDSCRGMRKAFSSYVLLCAISLIFVVPSSALSESDIKGAVLNVPTELNKDVNAAIGKDNKASQTSIVAKNIDAKGVAVNRVKSDASVNVAIGTKNQAKQDSVALDGGKVNGAVINSADTKNPVNVAIGDENTANQSAIFMKETDVKGAVINTSNTQNVINAALKLNPGPLQ